MKIDVFATERHFVDHLVPIWRALPESERGDFVVPFRRREQGSLVAAAHARSLGLEIIDEMQAENRPTLVASAGNLRKVIDRNGRTKVALLEHGSGQSFGGDPKSARHSSYPGGDRRPASLFIAPNVHAAYRDAQAYPDAETAIVGCPKLDDMPERSVSGPPTVAVSFHWNCRVAPETQSGFREFRRALPALVQRYRVIGHGHPRIIDTLEHHYRRTGITTVRDFRDVVSQAHVYINEGSSTLFEAAAAGIPVVVLNPPFFRRNVDHGLRFWDAANVGVNVNAVAFGDPTNDVLHAVEEALADSPERKAQREAALNIMYAYRTGAAQRAADTLLEWAEPRRVRKAA